ncbi:hypothetical protein PC129_g25012 [Phytophthora cactorum]|uniref:Uncharacterized protein n=1 Tax=Phytophthora cactorum TaxID=29920 RepID=A0A8T1JHR7_9STRA|nr:hypothetical protein PC129_g25012 [Phytophthora cactorum]KAG4223773.1 hypothetical protein PC116_g27759 [Phytophthora cactorum]
MPAKAILTALAKDKRLETTSRASVPLPSRARWKHAGDLGGCTYQ